VLLDICQLIYLLFCLAGHQSFGKWRWPCLQHNTQLSRQKKTNPGIPFLKNTIVKRLQGRSTTISIWCTPPPDQPQIPCSFIMVSMCILHIRKWETLEGKKTGSTSLIAELYDALPSSISHALLFHHGQHEHSAYHKMKNPRRRKQLGSAFMITEPEDHSAEATFNRSIEASKEINQSFGKA